MTIRNYTCRFLSYGVEQAQFCREYYFTLLLGENGRKSGYAAR